MDLFRQKTPESRNTRDVNPSVATEYNMNPSAGAPTMTVARARDALNRPIE